MSEEVVGQEQVEQNVEATEGQEATGQQPEATATDKSQIDAVGSFLEQQGIEGAKYFRDASGKLMFRVPIDGKVYETDFNGLVKGFNLNQAGYKKLEEGKAITKQFEGFINRLKQNPDDLWDFAERVGLDPIKLAEGRLQRAIEEQNMTEEQKQLRTFEKEKKKKEEELQDREKTLLERETAAESAKYQEKYSNALISALKKQGIAADKQSFNSMKGIAREAVKKVTSALEKGIDMNMEDAVIEARQDVESYIQDFLMQVDDDHIIDALPSEFVNRILKASLKRKVGTPTTNTIGSQVALKDTGTSKKSNKKPLMGDYFRNLK